MGAADSTGSGKPEATKQAVIIIHGIGEQRPMETLRSFVETAWSQNEKLGPLAGRETWLVPDETTGSLELRRFTTSYHGKVRTDFYEIYWADLMEGTTARQVWTWISDLLMRWPKRVPKPVFNAWIMLWILSLVAGALFLNSIFGTAPTWLPGDANVVLGVGVALIGLVALVWLAAIQKAGVSGFVAAIALPLAIGILIWWIVPPDWVRQNATGAWRLIPMALSAFLAFFINNVLVPYLGDISRYVRAAPDTIASRKAIRERGLKLIEELHDCGRYRRIVFAAHSLGCIIAYDLISEYWARRGPNPKNPGGPGTLKALEAIDKYTAWTDDQSTLQPPLIDLEDFRKAQRDAFEALRSESHDWLISDFVTLGCPLTHAEFLMARDQGALTQSKRERLFPVAPPLPDNMSAAPKERSLLYAASEDRAEFEAAGARKVGKWYPHHAAPFAVVRWTNIFDAPRAIFFGDLVSGPVVNLFGPGIRDRPVTIRRPFLFGTTWRLFTHTLYWDLPNARRTKSLDHIEALREAIAFDDV